MKQAKQVAAQQVKARLDQGYQKFSSVFTREMLEAVLPSLLMIGLALFFAYKFIDPAPPKKIVIATGDADLNYNAFASIYGVYLKKEGITLEVRRTSGDLENLRLLKNTDSGVDMAFIQDGVASSEGAGSLLSLGSLYYQPLWVFCRCKADAAHLSDLRGKRIAIGSKGEGSELLARNILQASGVNDANSRLLNIGGEAAIQKLLYKQVDAVLFVDVPFSESVSQLVNHPTIRLMTLDTAEALARQFSYLHHLVLPEGALNLKRNLPLHDVQLVAPTATLVVKEDMHPALVYLMMKIISQVHGGASILNAKGEFPSAKDTDFQVSTQALNFYKSGLPFIDKYLPFWAATFVNRTLIVLLPLLALLIPLTKIVPMVYVWLVKRKLFRYYGELRYLDAQLNEGTDAAQRAEILQALNEIDSRVTLVKLPVTFSQYAYELRAHIALVRAKLKQLQ